MCVFRYVVDWTSHNLLFNVTAVVLIKPSHSLHLTVFIVAVYPSVMADFVLVISCFCLFPVFFFS